MKKIIGSALIVMLATTNIKATSHDTIQHHWAQDSLDKLVQQQVILFEETGSFRPDEQLSRNDFMTILETILTPELMESLNTYRNDETIDQSEPISRQEATTIVTMICDAVIENADGNKLEEKTTTPEIADLSVIDHQYKENVIKTYQYGIFIGYDDQNFMPKQNLTRAEASIVVARLKDFIESYQQFEDVHPLTGELRKASKSDYEALLLEHLKENFDILDGKLEVGTFYQIKSPNYYSIKAMEEDFIPFINEIAFAFLKNTNDQGFYIMDRRTDYDMNTNSIYLTWTTEDNIYKDSQFFYRFILNEDHYFDGKNQHGVDYFSEKVNMTLEIPESYKALDEGKAEEVLQKLHQTLNEMFPDQGKAISQYILDVIKEDNSYSKGMKTSGIQVDYIHGEGYKFYLSF